MRIGLILHKLEFKPLLGSVKMSSPAPPGVTQERESL